MAAPVRSRVLLPLCGKEVVRCIAARSCSWDSLGSGGFGMSSLGWLILDSGASFFANPLYGALYRQACRWHPVGNAIPGGNCSLKQCCRDVQTLLTSISNSL